MSGHDHHHHHHVDPDAGDTRVFGAIAVNLLLTVAQIVGGILSGSLALIADALHNFSDAITLAIAYVARKIARKPADADMSFGYGRAEVVAALVNYTTLVVLALYLLYEAVMRFLDPQPIDGWMVIWIAALALVVDVVTAVLMFSMSKSSVNIRAAFLHNLADAGGSVAVIVSGALALLYGWWLVDPIVTALISAYILWHVYAEIGDVIGILMLGSPPGVELDEVADAMQQVEDVRGVHHVHLWRMQESESSLEAHVVLVPGAWDRADAVKDALKAMLQERFEVSHATIEMECARHACDDAPLIGHG